MRYLVIGGAGHIGSHLVGLLLEQGHHVVVLDNLHRGKLENLPKPDDKTLRIICADMGNLVFDDGIFSVQSITRTDPIQIGVVDGVFLLAALWLDECLNFPEKAITVNIRWTHKVIQACNEAGVRIVFSSSASVYGNALEIPMTEDHPFNNRTFYGATKIAGEQMLRAYNEMHGFSYIGLRYMNVYGPQMDNKGTYTSVIIKTLEAIDNGRRPIIYGDGTQSYDFVYVDDVARANLVAMESDISDEFFNIGTGRRTTINELVKRILDIAKSDLEPEYAEETGRTFVTHRIGSTLKAYEMLNFDSYVSLGEGLQLVIDWWRSK